MSDNRRLLIGMTLAMAVLLGWPWIWSKILDRNPQWKAALQPPAATQPAAPAPAPATQATAAPTTNVATTQGGGAPSISAAAVRVVSPATAPVAFDLGGVDPSFPLELRISTQGAGLERARLKDFKSADGKSVYTFQEPLDAKDASTRPLATKWVSVDGSIVDLSNVVWNVESRSEKQATLVVDLNLIRLRKHFELNDRNSPSKGFEVNVAHSFENTSQKPVTVKLGMTGLELPPREIERGPDQTVLMGYDNAGEVEIGSHLVEEFTPEKRSFDITVSAKEKLPLLWAGASSVYFNALLRPEPLEQGSASPKYVSKVLVEAINPEADPEERKLRMTWETSDLSLDAGKSLTLSSWAFLGPKKRDLLTNTALFSEFPRQYHDTLVLTGGFCGFCTFQWLINILVGMLKGFHFVVRDWGLAIIILVCIVRLLLHPITKKSQISMSKMAKMGPEMEKIKKKYADDKDAMNKALWDFQKTHGFTPVLGCLPMFLQMPIWIALWSALNSTFELRQAPFLWGFTWIHDLAKPDRLIYFADNALKFSLPLIGKIKLDSFNLLPLLLGVVFFLQQKFTPKPPAQTKEQEQQMKMMQWMSLLFPVFLYNGPSGLNLYIFTSTTIGIIESKRIRDHLKEREEAEKAGLVIVDAEPPRGGKGGGGKGGGAKAEEPKKKGFMAWFAEQQARIEEMRREKGK